MTQDRTFWELLRLRAEVQVPTVGYFNRRTSNFVTSSFRDVLERSAASAEVLLEAGVGVGTPIRVVAISPEGFLTGYLAAVLAQAVPVLMPLRPSLDRSDEMHRRLEMSDRRLPGSPMLIQQTDNGPCVDPGERTWLGLRQGEVGNLDALFTRPPLPSDHPFQLQLTSGSTDDFKPVVLTDGNLVSGTRALIERMEIGPGNHFVSWLPLYHDMGLVMSLAALTAGADLRLLSPFDFLADPTNWLRAIAQSPAAMTSAPNFAFDYTRTRVQSSESEPLDLSNWEKAYCGGEPVNSDTMAAFIERFGPDGLRSEVIQPAYGLAEATLLVTMPRTGDQPKQATIPSATVSVWGPVEIVSAGGLTEHAGVPDSSLTSVVSVGPPGQDVTIDIVDPEGSAVEGDGVAGEVVVSGGAVSPGYLNPDGTIDRFRDGRCPTGDVGFRYEGDLYLIERIKNLVIRHGQNYSAAAIERYLAKHTGVALDRCAVVQGVTENLVVAVLELPRHRTFDDFLLTMREAVAEIDLEAGIDEVVLVDRNGIPRTTSGKKQHSALRALLRNGELQVLGRLAVGPAGQARLGEIAGSEPSSPNPPTIDLDRLALADRVLPIVESHAKRRGWTGAMLNEDQDLANELGLDSMAVVEVMADIETTMAVALPEDRLGDIVTVGDLISIVEQADAAQDGGGIAQAIDELFRDIPQMYRHVESQHGRRLLIDGRWVTDFASVNYLGLDLDPKVMSSVKPMVQEWGVHPSWTRAVASPAPYEALERLLAERIEAPDAMVFSTVTLAHIGLLPLLATGADTLLLDRAAHNSVKEGAELAAARGATLRYFDHTNLDGLQHELRAARGRPVVALNGVYSMTGTVPDLDEICRLVADRGGQLYIDDAHGFGVLGKPAGSLHPYGSGGGGAGVHFGLRYDHVVYVAGLSKAFSSMAAFVSCSGPNQRALFERASTSIFSGPVPVASLASALAGLAVDAEEGDDRRRHLHELTTRVVRGATERGFDVGNPLMFPIVNLTIGDVRRTVEASKIMWEEGILFTPAAYPAAPLDKGGFRLSLTAANTHEDVERLLNALDVLAQRTDLIPSQLAQHK